ncbi:MAG: hypothetical protein GOVbin5978_35 [Prokaryotic dsDNA virus sp.]|nr:MAG: hypothetical protein GOVbin5978_35 [Prokaryotic dsDNA virus sp.]|tara:strand:+ start:1829 stop:2065 length:237 start_codon:yes stop_codon:yes gene_type:complete
MEEKTEQKENLRVFVDINVNGNANGGVFIESNLKDKVEELEASGEVKVVGVVYDETYNLEILTQPKGGRPMINFKTKK